MGLSAFLTRLLDGRAAERIPAMLTWSLAAVRGATRATLDVDVVIDPDQGTSRGRSTKRTFSRPRPPLWLRGSTHRVSDEPGTTQLPQAAYRGRPADQGVVAFLGIRYARPPVGRLRWREAAPLEASDRVIEADAFGPTCRQPMDPNEAASATRQDEDCLSLNVWTRRTSGSPRRVLLWIHGGANVSGGTADPLYDGHHFVRDNDVVLVSINYRLGPFGFLDLDDVGGPDYRRSRNLGLLDQLTALRWVWSRHECPTWRGSRHCLPTRCSRRLVAWRGVAAT